MILRELEPGQYQRVVEPLRALELNTLFARAVVEHGAPGRVYVDSPSDPRIVYVMHGYGMSLLAGGTGSSEGDDEVVREIMNRPRDAAEWLQVAPARWAERITSLAPPSTVAQSTRVNFTFSPELFRDRGARGRSATHRIARADRAAFEMPGTVIPRLFWRSAEEFLDAGAGFAVVVDDRPVSLAFSSFITPTELELGIETLARYRRLGLATLACSALIEHCLARNLEPIWSCRLENTGSRRLAESLGFVPTRHLPYLRLGH